MEASDRDLSRGYGAALWRPDDKTAGQARMTRFMVRAQLSPRPGPDEISQVSGIPDTLSGKKLEVPVRKILPVAEPEQAADTNALADPGVPRYLPRFQGIAGPFWLR